MNSTAIPQRRFPNVAEVSIAVVRELGPGMVVPSEGKLMLKSVTKSSRCHFIAQIEIFVRQELTKRLLLLLATFICIIPVFTTSCRACQVNDARPTFEVATIKPNVSNCCTSSKWSANQVTFSNQNLMHLIIFAYGLQPQQIVGPKWMESIHFDITAKYPPGTQFKDRLLMLRTLLEERFSLTVHPASKVMQAYELNVASSGFKLKPTDPGEGSYSSGEQGSLRVFRARKISMFDLAYDLADSLGEPVMDNTRVDGVYDFLLTWAGDDLISNQNNAESAPSLFTALQDTLGVRLVHRKISVPILVVDHVNNTPSEN